MILGKPELFLKLSSAPDIKYCPTLPGTVWISVRIPSFVSLAQQDRSYSFPNKPLLTTEHGRLRDVLNLDGGKPCI